MAFNYLTQYDSPNFTPAAGVPGLGRPHVQLRRLPYIGWGDPNTNPTFEGG